jgi:HSP20 family protein
MEKDFRFHAFYWERSIGKNGREWIFSPPTNVYETPESFVVLIEIPGVSKSELKVEVLGNSIVVRGTRRDPVCSGDTVFHNLEIHFGKFEKIIHINASFDKENIKVTYHQGFLRVDIPKKLKRIVEIDIEE